MLASLTIKNVVLIDQLTIDFQNGLCALTGETGAGKSILLDSLGLALGARSDAGLVRQGTDQASVTALFETVPDHPVIKFIEEQDLESDTTLILRRIVTKDGRSKAFVNDQPVSINLMKQVGEMLVEIHGQFDTQTLLNPKSHGGLLDAYAGHQSLIKAVKDAWEKWRKSQKELIEKQAAMDQAREDEAFFRTSLEDIDALAPKEGEETELTQLRSRLMQREQILDNLNEAQKGIEEIEGQVGAVWRALERLGEDGQEAIAAMDRANAELQEVLSSLTALSDDIDNSEYSLSEIDDRLFALKAQAKKHHCTIDTLPQKREEIAAALDAIDNQDERLASLQREVEKDKQAYSENAAKLSSARQKTAEKLSKLVMKELPALKLDKARFDVSVEKLDEKEWGKNGFDQIQFLVATNPGAAAGPLNKIASGGEMSRFMLALKVVMAEVGLEDTLIFDEVDSGIGGATAAAVGERLLRLAAHRQILVVTHSPQVAAMAGHHWIVSKEGQKEVVTNIIPLFETMERQEEIARMLSGAEITEEARAAAGKLLEASAA